MKPNGGGDKIARRAGKEDHRRISAGCAKMKDRFRRRPASPSSARAGAGSRSRTARSRSSKTAERREPAGPWRHADPRLRRLGAFLLHRLSQPPPRLSEGVRRSSGELGICRPKCTRRPPSRPSPTNLADPDHYLIAAAKSAAAMLSGAGSCTAGRSAGTRSTRLCRCSGMGTADRGACWPSPI